MPSAKIKGGDRALKFVANAKRTAQHTPASVEVGFYSTAKYPPYRTGINGGQKRVPQPVTNVAAWNEYGTRYIPERPFMRISARIARNRANSRAPSSLNPHGILRSGVDPKTMTINRRTAELAGLAMASIIQKTIRSLSQPPNAERTIKQKGSSNPLIDTGVLRQAVTHKIKYR